MSLEFSSYLELPITISAEYEPAQHQTRTDPAWAECVTINDVTILTDAGEVSIINQIDDADKQRIMEEALEAGRNQRTRRSDSDVLRQIAKEETERFLASADIQRGVRL